MSLEVTVILARKNLFGILNVVLIKMSKVGINCGSGFNERFRN